jgi:molecular chaperone HtpG
MDHMIDNHWLQHLEQKLDKVMFVRVDSDTVDNLVQKDETAESVLSEKEQEKVKGLFEVVLKGQKHAIQLKPMSPDVHPVVITRPEFMRRMKEMQQMQGMSLGDFPDSVNVVINTNHPLVAEKLVNMRSAEKKEKFAKYLYDLARLNQHMLKGEEMNAFIAESIEFLK